MSVVNEGDFLFNIGDRVIVNVPPSKHGIDGLTGLVIPKFFYELNGMEFTVGSLTRGANYLNNQLNSCRRYSFEGFHCGEYLMNYLFDEYWLEPACNDIEVEVVDFW